MANNNYFLLSGFIAVSLFLFFFILFAIMMFIPTKINSYGLEKKNYVSVSLAVANITKTQPKAKKKSSQQAKSIDVNNLFSDVWTKSIVHKTKKTKPKNTRRILDIQKKISTSKDNDVKSISEKVNSMENIDTKELSETSSSGEEINEYLAKIQAIVYQYFRVPQNTQGSSVKTVIELNALGKVLDFRVLSYSDNEALNKEADLIKQRLSHVVFPKNPNNQFSRTVVILISKE